MNKMLLQISVSILFSICCETLAEKCPFLQKGHVFVKYVVFWSYISWELSFLHILK